MKKMVKWLLPCMLIMAVAALAACGPSTPEKAYDKLKADIAAAGYTVTEFTAEQIEAANFPVKADSGFKAVKDGETFVLIFFNDSLEGKTLDLSGGFASLGANGGYAGSHGRFAYSSSTPDEVEAGRIFSKIINKNNSGQ
ncbi:MAG: hypothetical protein FWH03_03435 [Firmicutes bacterium]|nr:hypothetical protein [Bacillota bacterium]